MQDWLSSRVQATPDTIAIVDKQSGTSLTYYDLYKQVLEQCVRWQRAGIERGDHVGVIAQSNIETVLQIHTAFRMGVVLVPLNARLTPDEMDFQLKQADVQHILPYGTADALRVFRTRGHHVVLFDDEPVNKITARKHAETQIDLAQPGLIVHTSGTTGKPKGAVLSNANLFYNAMASAYRIGHQTDDKWLCILPLYHVGGLSILVRAVLYGITVQLHSQFDIEQINQSLQHDDITLISLVPTMLYRLLQHRETAWSSCLRLVLLGGAATSPQLMQQCLDEGIPVATTYGLTEAASQVATTLPGIAARKPGTVGKPLLFSRVRIVDEDGADVPPNQHGEVIVRGKSVMMGYYNNPEATNSVIRDGWLHTGDIGYLDEDGDLWLVQRRSDLIVSGGENVYPVEVENVLRDHPAIQDVAVVGVADDEWGERVGAVIVRKGEATLDHDTVMTYARQHLAGYKIPRVVMFTDELPQTASGKIKRPAVRALFEQA